MTQSIRAAASKRTEIVEGTDAMKQQLNASRGRSTTKRSPNRSESSRLSSSSAALKLYRGEPSAKKAKEAKPKPGESTSAYAIRMAGERRKQRETRKAKETMALSMYQGEADEVESSEEGEAEELPERYDGSDAEDEDEDEGKEKSAVPSQRTPSFGELFKSTMKVWTIIALVVMVIGYFWVESAQFCDTDQTKQSGELIGIGKQAVISHA